MILGFFFLFHFLEVLSGREGFFAKKGGVSLVRNRDLRPAAKAYPTIQQAFERFQKYNRLKNLSQGSLDYNSVDMKDRALKYIVSELWNPLVNAQILGRKRPLDEGDTCAVYLLHYPKERLEGELKKIEKYQLEPVKAYRKWFDDRKAWKAYLHQPETVEILKKAIQSFWTHGKVNTAGGSVRPCRLV